MDSRQRLTDAERGELLAALCGSVQDGTAVYMGRDTSFIGAGPWQEETDAAVVDAIASVPTHY